MGGKFHLMLNIGERPIANKYCEGKMKRTLERELKVPEIADREVDRIGLTDEYLVHEGLNAFITVRDVCMDAVVCQFSPSLTSIGWLHSKSCDEYGLALQLRRVLRSFPRTTSIRCWRIGSI